MKTKIAIGVALIVVAAGVGSYASPYLTMHEMRSAIVDNDADAFSSYVDYPALRENLRAQMMVALQQKAADDPEIQGNGGAALGMAMAAGVVNEVIDVFITPSSVMKMVSKGQPRSAARTTQPADSTSADSSSSHQKDYSVRYRNWSTVVATANENGPEPIAFIFKRDGLWSWKLTGIKLPLDRIMG